MTPRERTRAADVNSLTTATSLRFCKSDSAVAVQGLVGPRPTCTASSRGAHHEDTRRADDLCRRRAYYLRSRPALRTVGAAGPAKPDRAGMEWNRRAAA